MPNQPGVGGWAGLGSQWMSSKGLRFWCKFRATRPRTLRPTAPVGASQGRKTSCLSATPPTSCQASTQVPT